jgi:hypothetical protein
LTRRPLRVIFYWRYATRLLFRLSKKILWQQIQASCQQKRDINSHLDNTSTSEDKSVGQGWGGCREGPVRPSQLRAGAPPA